MVAIISWRKSEVKYNEGRIKKQSGSWLRTFLLQEQKMLRFYFNMKDISNEPLKC